MKNYYKDIIIDPFTILPLTFVIKGIESISGNSDFLQLKSYIET